MISALLICAAPIVPVVRVFVMTDCPISRQYMPELKRISHDYKLSITLVHEDPETGAAQAKAFDKQFGVSFPFELDPKHAVAHKLGVSLVPTAVVLVEGKVAYLGRIDDRYPNLISQKSHPATRDLRNALYQLLAKKPVTVAKTPVVGCVIPKS